MTSKKKKSILLVAVSLMLVLISYGKKFEQEKRLEKARELVLNYEENTLSVTSDLLDNKKFYDFYKEFLNRYVIYMDEEQCNEFYNMMIENCDTEENFPYNITFAHLDKIMGVEENKFGRGILRAFNMRLVYENILPALKFDDEVFKEINTLRMIVADDKAFFSSLFSGNIDEFTECIKSHTGFDSTQEIDELILQFDCYSDLLENEEYNDKELQEKYKKRIEQIMSELIKSKLATDEEFSNTLYGKIISNSKYNSTLYKYSIYNTLFDDDTSIYVVADDLLTAYSFSIPSKYLYMNVEIDEIKAIKVCDIIKKGDNENNGYENDAMKLMIHLIEPSTLADSKLSSAKKRELLYENLKDEFETIEDFDDFFLSIANGTSMVYYDYFDVFEHRIKKEGINYDDFVRFTSLANFINENNDIFDGMDYKICMEMIDDLIKDNNLGYEQLYSPDCEYVYKDGCVYVEASSASVLSEEIFPVIGSIGGNKIIYYEIPDNYETGIAVDSFYNTERNLTIVQVGGIKETFIDEISGKIVNGFIVAFGDEIDKTLTPIRFMECYTYYEENKKDKGLILEDK